MQHLHPSYQYGPLYHLQPGDLMREANIVAVLVCNAAMCLEKLPGKALVAAGKIASGADLSLRVFISTRFGKALGAGNKTQQNTAFHHFFITA